MGPALDVREPPHNLCVRIGSDVLVSKCVTRGPPIALGAVTSAFEECADDRSDGESPDARRRANFARPGPELSVEAGREERST